MPEQRTARENARLEIGSQRGRNSHRLNFLGIFYMTYRDLVMAALSCWWLICDIYSPIPVAAIPVSGNAIQRPGSCG